jgi:hypothetical protein
VDRRRDLVRARRRGQAQAGAAQRDPGGVVGLVAGKRDHQQRHAVQQCAADGPVTALADHQVGLGHEGVMGGRRHDAHGVGGVQVRGFDVRAGGYDCLGLDRPDGAHDPPEEVGLVLGTGAPGHEDARPVRPGPQGPGAPRPDRFVEQRADVAVIGGEHRPVKVEGLADRQEDPLGPFVVGEGGRHRRQPECAACVVERRSAALHCQNDRVGCCVDRGPLRFRPRRRQAAGGGGHTGQRANADMRRQDGVRDAGHLGGQGAADQQVDAEDRVGREATDLVERVRGVGACRGEHGLAQPIGQI